MATRGELALLISVPVMSKKAAGGWSSDLAMIVVENPSESFAPCEDYLLSEQEMSLDAVEFRKKAKMSAKERAQVEAQVLHVFERYLAVEELLGLTIKSLSSLGIFS